MSIALLLALLCTAAPPAAEAESLAARRDAETLFLKFGAVGPDDYEPAERARVARALRKAAQAARKDPAIAIGLLERSVLLVESPEALTLLAELELGLDERASAARHFDRALELQPRHLPALLGRGDLAVKEQDYAVAVEHFDRAVAAGAKNARKRLEKARAALAEKEQAVSALRKAESDIQLKVAQAARDATRDWMRQIAIEEEEAATMRRLAPDGVRQQKMANFVFTYSAANRNSGQMFAFERRVEKVLEKTYDFVSDRLGYKLKKVTPVVLMTRAEYQAAYAGTPMSRAGGFWDGKQIVINGGAELNAQFAQVMVHEFTHAVVDDLGGSRRVPRWINEGLAENMRLCAIGREGRLEERERAALKAIIARDGLPPLDSLDGLFQSMGPGVELAYWLSSVAVHQMIERRGYREFVEMLREMRRGRRPEPIIERRFMSLERLHRDLKDELT